MYLAVKPPSNHMQQKYITPHTFKRHEKLKYIYFDICLPKKK